MLALATLAQAHCLLFGPVCAVTPFRAAELVSSRRVAAQSSTAAPVSSAHQNCSPARLGSADTALLTRRHEPPWTRALGGSSEAPSLIDSRALFTRLGSAPTLLPIPADPRV